MRKLLFALLAGLAIGSLAIGCHAQIPLKSHAVVLNWGAPVPVSGDSWQTPCGTATGDAPCTYVLSRITAGTISAGCPVQIGRAHV